MQLSEIKNLRLSHEGPKKIFLHSHSQVSGFRVPPLLHFLSPQSATNCNWCYKHSLGPSTTVCTTYKIHRLSIRTYRRDRLYRTWGTYYSVLPVYTAYPSPTACNDMIQTSTWLFISPSGNNNLYETVSSVLINKRFTAVLCHLPSGIITDVIMLVIFVFTNSKPAPYQIGSILCHLEFKSSSITKLNTEECKKLH